MSGRSPETGGSHARRCVAAAKSGKPCRAWAMEGRDVCKSHSGDADIGRPTRLSQELTHKIALLIRVGNYFAVAARTAGVPPATFYAWRERGEADLERDVDTVFAEFAEAVERAKAESQATSVAIIRTAATQGDWKAAAWMLERQFPEEWGARTETRLHGEVKHSSGDAGPDLPTDAERLAEVARVLASIGVIDTPVAVNGELG